MDANFDWDPRNDNRAVHLIPVDLLKVVQLPALAAIGTPRQVVDHPAVSACHETLRLLSIRSSSHIHPLSGAFSAKPSNLALFLKICSQELLAFSRPFLSVVT